ncbi:MAG TPA: hypothetical protein VF188_09385 [Longimicrobiales bacterium]
MSRSGLLLSNILAAMSTFACDNGAAPRVPQPEDAAIIRFVSGTSQTGAPGETLPDPVVVEVVTDDGIPVSNVGVSWDLRYRNNSEIWGFVNGKYHEGTITDGNGRTSVVLTLGPEIGEYSLQADPVTNALPEFAYFEAIINDSTGN